MLEFGWTEQQQLFASTKQGADAHFKLDAAI